MNPSPRARSGEVPAWVLFLCFFLSGVAGLVYEVVWSKYLALFMGSTGEAHVIILSTYMGGLALGAWIFGRRADRVADPLRLYVMLELGIGLMGIVYPRLFEPVRQLFIAMVRGLGLGPGALHFSAVFVCVLTLLPPTTLMGGTLPVLGRHMIRSRQAIGRRIASLYYLNSLGAVLGSLIAGFWITRAVGLEFSLIIAGALNLTVACAAWMAGNLARSGAEDGAEGLIPPEASPLETARAAFEPGAARRLSPASIAVVVIGLSGLASMVYEVAWIRLLALVLGSSSFSFSLMLAAFIFGITLGSFLLSLKPGDSGHSRILGWCELMIGLTALVSIMGYQRLPVILNHWRTSLNPSEHTYGLFQFVQFLLCFMVMVVPTVFMGVTVPAASRVAAAGMEGLGRRIGNVFAVNTAGTLIGAVFAGFVMLPLLGIRHTIEAAVALNVALGLWVLAADPGTESGGALGRRTAWALALGVPLLYVFLAPQWDRRVFSAATYRSRVRIESHAAFREQLEKRKFLYYKDGADATIAVCEDTEKDGRVTRALLINGKPDASNTGDMVTQLLVGHLPMLIHPNPENVLVVGLGAGISAGATTLYNAKRIECVELIPEVVEAAAYFKEYTHDVTNHPVAKIIVQDAKTFLQVTPEKYDVIVNQPTNLWISGVAGLFTTEYFEACRSRMRDGGLFILWIQAYEMLDTTMFSILETFNDVFPYSTIFNLNGMDVAVVGCTRPFEPDFALMERRLADPRVAGDLAPFGVRGILPILSMQMAVKTDSPGPWVQITGANSDFFPVLEHEAARGFFIGSSASGLGALDQRAEAPGRGRLWINGHRPAEAPSEEIFADYLRHIRVHKPLGEDVERMWLDLWREYHPDSRQMLLARAALKDENELWRLAAVSDDRLATDPLALTMKSGLLWEKYESERNCVTLPESADLRSVLSGLVERRVDPLGGLIGLGDLELDARNPAAALARYQEALRLRAALPGESPSEAMIKLRAAAAMLDLGRADDVLTLLAEIDSTRLDGKSALEHHLLRCGANRLQAPKAN